MTVTEMIQQTVETMCDKYCKMPERYLATIKDPDEAQETMIEEVCKDCPLNKLV